MGYFRVDSSRHSNCHIESKIRKSICVVNYQVCAVIGGRVPVRHQASYRQPRHIPSALSASRLPTAVIWSRADSSQRTHRQAMVIATLDRFPNAEEPCRIITANVNPLSTLSTCIRREEKWEPASLDPLTKRYQTDLRSVRVLDEPRAGCFSDDDSYSGGWRF